MTELFFHDELYDGFAIDEAVKVYVPFAAIELRRDQSYYVVRVTCKEGGELDERLVCAELVNYALGRTVERREAKAPDEPSSNLSSPQERAQ